MSKNYVYHIPDPYDKEDTNLGYIGVSTNLQKRFDEHSISKYTIGNAIRNNNLSFEDVVVINIFENDVDKLAYKEENKMRPSPFIGWNIAAGGNGGWSHVDPSHPGDKNGMYNSGMLPIIDTDGNQYSIDKNKYDPDLHTPIMSKNGEVNVKDRGGTKRISKEGFKNGDYESINKNKVVCKRISTGEMMSVDKETFESDPDLVGSTKGTSNKSMTYLIFDSDSKMRYIVEGKLRDFLKANNLPPSMSETPLYRKIGSNKSRLEKLGFYPTYKGWYLTKRKDKNG